MTQRLQNLVVGTSLSAESDPVVRAALTLAGASGAAVHLVHGFPLPVVYGGGIYGGAAIHSQLQHDEDRYQELLGVQLRRLGTGPEALASTTVEMEGPDRLIARVADEKNADLIVVGASEGPAALGPILGSTADRLLRRTHRPVLVVRGDVDPPRRVLAPVDLSKLSGQGVARALDLVADMGPDPKLDLTLLFVLSRIDREGSAHFEPAQVDRFALEELQSFAGRLDHPEEHTHCALRNGQPRQEILDYAAEHPADLVVLGTHGRSGLERFLLGSVAAGVLRHLPVSALVIPPAEADSEDDEGG
ncbi:MAG: universal stress protein [Acidobacteriota bacterium]